MPFTPTYFPVPSPNQTRDFLSVFQFISNDATEGLFFPVMIFVIFIVQFIGVLAEGRRASRAWVFASFTATILSIILGILAMMAQKWIYLLILMVSIGAFWTKLATARE